MTVLFFLICYLLGSIPTALLTGKLFFNLNVLEHGSGSSGATNAFRVFGWKVGVSVMLFDIFKGVLATAFISQFIVLEMDMFYIKLLCGVLAIAGHTWSVFIKFKGGKGVATAAGMLIGLSPITVSIALVLFFILVFSTRYISVASIVAGIAVPIVLQIQKYFFGFSITIVFDFFTIFLALFIIYTHRTNIKRLLNGTENKLSFKKST